MDETIERRIRDRAYRLWEEEGRPAGRDVDHWLRAAQEVAAEVHARNGADTAAPPAAEAAGGAKPKRTRSPRAAKPKETADPPAAAAKAEPAKKRKTPKSG